MKISYKLKYKLLFITVFALFGFSMINIEDIQCKYGTCTVNLGNEYCKSCIYKVGVKTCFLHRDYTVTDNVRKNSSSYETTNSKPRIIFGMADIEQLISLSQISENEYNSSFGRYAWSGWEYDEHISERGCLEKSWTKTYDGDFGLLTIEKCGEFVNLTTMVTGMYEGMRDNPFTILGKKLIPYRIGYDDGLTSYRIVKGSKAYIIKVNWQYKFIFVMPENK